MWNALERIKQDSCGLRTSFTSDEELLISTRTGHDAEGVFRSFVLPSRGWSVTCLAAAFQVINPRG
ncbi:hypothetical protein ABEW19_01045 [Paenibacillus illinoisensis]|uniref:hypothetical protein n=1 Tax=Paenibacillus illinoisensis TaxID=59845 RepID=UPI003D2A30BE